MQNYAGTVVNVLATQFADHVVATADEEAGKAQLTRAAAWEIYKADATVGLRRKDYGNQVHGLSVDTIVDNRTGEVVDIATSRPDAAGTVRILPGWYPYTPNPDEVQNYIQPSAELAALPGPMPTTTAAPGPGLPPLLPTGSADVLAKLDEVLLKLDRAEEVQARDTAMIIARDDLNTDRVLGELNRLSEELQATAKKVLAIWMASRPDDGAPPVEGEQPPPNELLLLLLKKYIENRP